MHIVCYVASFYCPSRKFAALCCHVCGIFFLLCLCLLNKNGSMSHTSQLSVMMFQKKKHPSVSLGLILKLQCLASVTPTRNIELSAQYVVPLRDNF